ncbi:vesicle-associated membrane-protein-associated protein [Artemisia annua]|uniref:Vesicle-associated membrane-protein-associated protein n=1 Tax=Artemisia annua TaxID=35608 RepID=A0A2U1PSL7_ARTAN|nr:vesicle-associated membrane-protein-associated protein [Artemisia annua]
MNSFGEMVYPGCSHHIHPVEYKKPSSCSIRLANKSDYHVAFKVKTTSAAKYCVRPNAGVIKPNSASDFTVTMQPQREPARDFICKDKFLIQSTIVPKGTKEEHITSSMFAKEEGKLVEEKKLKVILLSPFNSPVLSPINGISRMKPSYTTTESEDNWVENNSFHAKVRAYCICIQKVFICTLSFISYMTALYTF